MTRSHDEAVSHWWQDLGTMVDRPRLEERIDADVCIVGAGLTGLWTAYYLKERDPSLRVVVVEAEFAGFGASGRNGGWLTNSVTGGVDQYVARHGRAAAARQQAAMNQSVDEVIRVAATEGISADIRKGGELIVARNAAQLARVEADLAHATSWPGTDWQAWSADEVRDKIQVRGALGGMWHPHCATLHPAKLVSGLARVVERRGVTIYENSPAEDISPGIVRTTTGAVRARSIIRATEGFTSQISGHRRTWLPMNSSMIATAPLDAHNWETIGWKAGEALADSAHMYIYAQRTADDRIAIGGRGVPYKFGSRFDAAGATPRSTIETLTKVLHDLFPTTKGIPVDRAWSGVLGVPRDWSATVTYDPVTGLGHAGGYVGTGVSTTNLSGRTLSDLVLGRQTELTSLPWVGHTARRWEPEPLRWLGVSSIYGAYKAADRAEWGGRPGTSRWARIANSVSGRQ
ncbi:FAD-dependent oxidoreductase [Aeromicrobium sp. Root236]|uniref:NAD(P)/FAD-dependent oxidoreductase n=1 Tax=Aeromicrobium sp. Root236 TaxID=1736498 RepID=UPI0006F81D33|nr:FAD-dependent oxidoreductase [Aeromicrobium sp. Root236]KRC65789.1 FAD-dependent oxidoreductase [Aeromicrobium sp. Root236]